MIIVGAGLCGLTLARSLQDSDHGPIIVIEKSRGVGGRMATRRTAVGSFDHGAQFYSLKPALQGLHDRWLKLNLVQSWFIHKNIEHFCCNKGLTALAKNLADSLDVRFEHKVSKIERTDNGWKLFIENHDFMQDHEVILTCPLPQSLELLKISNIPYDSSLNQIQYAKAVVVLFEKVQSSKSLAGDYGYNDQLESKKIFSITDQFKKGLTNSSAWVVTMNSQFSEDFFNSDDFKILDQITKEILRLDPDFKFESQQLKKWRYSHPVSIYSKPFYQLAPSFFLAGDAFGGPSLNGAAKSALNLSQELIKVKFEK